MGQSSYFPYQEYHFRLALLVHCFRPQDVEAALSCGGPGPGCSPGGRALSARCRALHCPMGAPALCLDLQDEWLAAGEEGGVLTRGSAGREGRGWVQDGDPWVRWLGMGASPALCLDLHRERLPAREVGCWPVDGLRGARERGALGIFELRRS